MVSAMSLDTCSNLLDTRNLQEQVKKYPGLRRIWIQC